MKAVMIFNSANTLIFSKCNDDFVERIKGFTNEDEDPKLVDSYSVSQLLAPIITSQRVMGAQFGNTYSSMQCKDGTNIVFDELLDYVFVIIGEMDVDDMHRDIMDCKTYVQHICGQNLALLQSPLYQDWLSVLLDSHTKGDSIPGASGVIGESGATAAALNCLKVAAKDIKSSYHHYHVMLYVGDKMLALYSSRGSEDLTPPDLILLSTQCVAAQEYWADVEKGDTQKNGGRGNHRLPWLSEENSAIVNLCAGSNFVPCSPHSMHLAEVAERVTLAVVVNIEIRDLGIATQFSNQILCNLRKLLLQRNLESLPTTLDTLELALKKVTDIFRKNKANANLCVRINTCLLELRKSCTTTTPLTPETAASGLHKALELVVEQLRPAIPALNLDGPLKELRDKLAPFVDFLRVKAMRYFSLGSGSDVESSCSLTRHKYVEEFPGLIHFVYVNRTTGRFLAPDMADCADMLTPQAVRAMMSRSLKVFREGYGAATWRAGAVHACAMLWWERGGVPVAPRALHPAAVRALPTPGDVCGAFYRQLSELAFPKETGVCVKELLCIHLGLLPAATAVQQARRLAHTVHDVAGEGPAYAADLL